MAEVVGLVTGVAGLTPLVTGVVGGIRRLRRIRRDSSEIPEGLDALIKELSFLQVVIENSHAILHGPGADYCQESIIAVAKGIEELLDKFPLESVLSGKKPKLKEVWDLRHWKEDVNALRGTVEKAKQDLVLCLQTTQLNLIYAMIQTPNLGAPSNPEASSSSDLVMDSEALSSSSPVKHTPHRRVMRRDCAVRACSCSCHRVSRISRRFWALDYIGLLPPGNKCDQPSCNASAYGFRLRVALSQLGIPWSVTMGLRLLARVGSYTIQPALQVERVVKYTSPGFEIIWRLENELIKVDEACMAFRKLAREDPSLNFHADPSGSSYIDTLLMDTWGSMRRGSTTEDRRRSDDQLSLLRVLMSELEVTRGRDSKRFLINCAKRSEANAHIALLETALESGFDPTTIDSPISSELSHPRLGMTWEQDPLLLQFLTLLCKNDQGFGGMTPLHEAVLFGKPEDVQHWATRSKKNERNFLGQTPLHLAISRPQHLQTILDAGHDRNAFDGYKLTPLMYAAVCNEIDAAKILIRAGADPLLRHSTNNSTFANIAISRTNWDFVMNIIRFLDDEAMHATADLLAKLVLSHLFRGFKVPEVAGRDDCLLQSLSICKSLNFCPDLLLRADSSQVSEARTLLHYARSAEEVDALLDHGFTMINQVDQKGQHALMTVIYNPYNYDPYDNDPEPIIARLLDAGADINLQDKRGYTVCHSVTQHYGYQSTWDTGEQLDYLHTLIPRGADVLIPDNCRCSCSVSGCLPTVVGLALCFIRTLAEDSAALLTEWIILIFEICGKETAKQILLATIRRSKHKKLDMTHTCCRRRQMDFFNDVPYPDLMPEDDIDDILEEESEFTTILDDKMEQESKKDFNSLLRTAILDTKPPMNQTGHRRWLKISIGNRRLVPRHYVDHENDQFGVKGEWNFASSSNQIRIVLLCVSSYILWLERRFRKSESYGQATGNPWGDGYLRRLSWLHYLCNVMEISTEELIVELRREVALDSKMTSEKKSVDADIEHFCQSWEEWSTKGPAMGVGSTDGFADWPLEEASD
ncbi:hypothetical protein CDV31_008033 [Fusarium ambrosium]|uniref:Fungal N-terminal domain-containing protein n=1 Tax=Fusarium ambrosium TaxID=131363 RepID=A0A428U348_9HYPO|nr:hypothetical protein CDV31_008033 [Fusarium ambrosium]